MLTGRMAFAGETLADVIPAILERHPDWTALPQSTPANVRRLLRRCLEKDSRHRLRDIGDARLELAADRELELPGPAHVRWTRTGVVLAAVTLSAVALVSATLGAFLHPSSRNSRSEMPVRFSISPPPGTAFTTTADNTFLAFSPDGSQLAFVATESAGATRIWLRPLSALDARPLAGTEAAASVFWSPDGQSLGFFAEHKLKRADLRSNAITTICDVPQAEGMTGTCGRDGRILFAPVTGTTIFSVSATGGAPSAAIVLKESKDGVVQWPAFVSDGRRFVYIVRPPDRSVRRLMLAEPGRAPRPILSVDSNVQWMDPDYFVFARRDGTLVAQRFNLENDQPVGELVPITSGVSYGFGREEPCLQSHETGTWHISRCKRSN
jgi:hypothetical protein